MKGMVFNIFESLVEEKFGDDMLEEIYDQAELSNDVPPFVGPLSYPDSYLFSMIGVLSEKTGLPVNDLVYEFGRYTFPVFVKNFPDLFDNVETCFDFLKDVDNIHEIEVKKIFEEAIPPRIMFTYIDESRATVKYFSERKLCRMFEGLLEELAAYCEESLALTHTECMHNGAPECVYEIELS